MSRAKLIISLSQKEILGDEKYINVNVTKCKKYVYFLIASFGYLINGLFVGWGSNFFNFAETEEYFNFNLRQISLITSGYPLGIVVTSIALYFFFYHVGTKYSMIFASLLMTISWFLLTFGMTFEVFFIGRFIGGIASGVLFVLLPTYMKELMGHQFSSQIIDLLIFQFGFGVFLQFLSSYIDSHRLLGVLPIIVCILYCIICFLIPESPRYQAYCHHQESLSFQDVEKNTIKEQNILWTHEDLQRKTVGNLISELRKKNLFPVIGLILFEQFIGGISILFYMKKFAVLTGGEFSSEIVAICVGLVTVLSIPIYKVFRLHLIKSIKLQIIISTLFVLLSLVSLALFCHTEGFMGQSLKKFRFIPLVSFLMMSFFYVAGISRNTLLILHQVIECYSLQLLLKNCSVGVVWFFIFGITKIIPELLYLIGVGYFYCLMIIFTICALVFIVTTVPNEMEFEKLAASKSASTNGSSCDNNSNVGSVSSETSSINEIKIENN